MVGSVMVIWNRVLSLEYFPINLFLDLYSQQWIFFLLLFLEYRFVTVFFAIAFSASLLWEWHNLIFLRADRLAADTVTLIIQFVLIEIQCAPIVVLSLLQNRCLDKFNFIQYNFLKL